MELKIIIAFIESQEKKLKIKTIRTKLENIVPSIWIEWWNWKLIKHLQKIQGKTNPKNKDKIKEYNIW